MLVIGINTLLDIASRSTRGIFQWPVGCSVRSVRKFSSGRGSQGEVQGAGHAVFLGEFLMEFFVKIQ